MWNIEEMSQLDATLARGPLTLTFDLDRWPWIFKVKLCLGNGRPDCHGMKGTGVDTMPWYETLRKWVNWMLLWLRYLWPWIFKVKLYFGNWSLDCHGTKGTWVFRMPWCETLRKWVNWMLRWRGYLWSWIFKVKLYFGNWRPDCHGMKGTGVDSISWCTHNHNVTPRQRILLPTGWLKMLAFPSTRLVVVMHRVELLMLNISRQNIFHENPFSR